MRLRSLVAIVALFGASARSFAQTPDPSLAVLADELAVLWQRELRAPLAPPILGPVPRRDRISNSRLGTGINSTFDKNLGKDTLPGDLAKGALGNAALGGAINAAFVFADLLGKASEASSLLDQLIDGTLEPNIDGYTQGSPDIPTSLCEGAGTKVSLETECIACFNRAQNNLTQARYNLEKLRVSAAATKGYVSSKIAVGDGLSGLTGLAALEWQRQRSGINKQFDKYKITYDGKYEEMMKGLQTAITRYDSCESQFGERDWYNRFGFLYVQFMADKYKRNF